MTTNVHLLSINQHINNAPWYRGASYSADYADAKRNVLSRVLNVLTDGANLFRKLTHPVFHILTCATLRSHLSNS